MKTIYFITGNKGKFSEVNEKLKFLDIKIIQKACKYLEGQHDFINFSKKGKDHLNTLRDMDSVSFSVKDDFLFFQFKSRGFTVKKRIANQLIDAYSRVPSQILRNLIRSFNKFWFRYIKIPYAAGGNILILQLEKVE